MKEYIMSISLATLISAVADLIAPTEWKKYLRVLLGFLLLYVIISPISAIKGISIPEFDDAFEKNTYTYKSNISEELTNNIEKDISERMKNEFGQRVIVNVFLAVNDKNEITAIEKIKLVKGRLSQASVKRLKEIYGCDDIEY